MSFCRTRSVSNSPPRYRGGLAPETRCSTDDSSVSSFLEPLLPFRNLPAFRITAEIRFRSRGLPYDSPDFRSLPDGVIFLSITAGSSLPVRYVSLSSLPLWAQAHRGKSGLRRVRWRVTPARRGARSLPPQGGKVSHRRRCGNTPDPAGYRASKARNRATETSLDVPARDAAARRHFRDGAARVKRGNLHREQHQIGER
jgi:hypothetical protein